MSASDPTEHAAAYLEHDLPARWPAGSVCPARVRVRNLGARTWQREPADGHGVALLVACDGQVVALEALPRSAVEPAGEASFQLVLPVPEAAGPHEYAFDLVEHGVTVFSAQGVAKLRLTLEAVPETLLPSERLAAAARRSSAWHYQPTRGLHRGRDGARYPLFVAEARGCRLTDADGREYLDYVMGWGAALLGYAHPRVQAALARALGSGAVLPFPVADEIAVAERLNAQFPGAGRVNFGKNGSDVCTLAARLARVLSGRHTLLYSGYHGWQDFWAEQAGFAQSGIPARAAPLIHRFRMNDVQDFLRLFEAHRADLAAVFVEPAGAVEGEQGPLPDADAAFLRLLRAKTDEAGALLVFDEIMTGFRYRSGSVQQAVGVVPDLTCLGKALGGGMPLSALVGRAELMERGMGRTHYGPTFKGEAYSLAAARAALEVYREEPVAEHVARFGEALRSVIDEAARRAGLAARCIGPSFRMVVAFDEPDLDRQRLLRTLLHQELLREGVVTYKGFMLPSYAHDERALEQSALAFDRALRSLAAAEAGDRLEQALEIPLLGL